jgi:ribosomal protein L37E
MGHKTTTTWTCDRCGVKVVLDEREQPNTWTHWYFRTPPNAASEVERSTGILCNECGELAVEFIHSKDEQIKESKGE